jgi:Holliday junction DNA helicase RuvB
LEDNRLMDGAAERGELSLEVTLRPERLDEYVGQERIKANLAVFLEAALQRGEPLDHVLLYGPPGLGKTTLAHVIAHEMDRPIRVSSGPSIEKIGELAAILTNLEAGEILWSGPAARSVRLELRPFTLVGATTRYGLLSPPLRDRFGIVHHLDYYGTDDLAAIALRSARILGIRLEPGGADEIARRSRGTPRVTNRLLRRVRDFVQVEGAPAITAEAAAGALARLQVDQFGLDEVDRRLLETILHKFDGGPVGVATLAAAVGEDRGTLEEIYEPYLMQIGFLDRTPRGRRVTRRAREHLGHPDPDSLF